MDKRVIIDGPFLEVKDTPELKRYMEFVIKNAMPKNCGVYCERHHLFPRSLYPQFEKAKWNIFRLKAEDHLRAHYYLYKALPNNVDMVYAFNMMLNRADKGKNFTFSKTQIDKIFESEDVDREYTEFRQYVAKAISKANKGRKHSEEEKQRQSEQMRGLMTVRDKDGNTYFVKHDDPRVLSGEFVHICVGRKHSEETRRKMSENGIKGRVCVHNENGEILFVSEEEAEKYERGLTEERKKILSDAATDFYFYTNEETGKTIRVKKGEEVPVGYVRKREKRGGFVGFDDINKTVRAYDIKERKIVMIPKKGIDFQRYIIQPPIKLEDVNYIKINGMVFIAVQDLYHYLLGCGVTICQPYTKNYSLLISHLDDTIIFPKTTVIGKNEARGNYEKRKMILNEIHKQAKRLGDLLPLQVVNIQDLVYGQNVLYVSEEKVKKYNG